MKTRKTRKRTAESRSGKFPRILYLTRILTYYLAVLPVLIYMWQIDKYNDYLLPTLMTILLMPHLEETIRTRTECYKNVDIYLFVSPAFITGFLFGFLNFSVYIFLSVVLLSYAAPVIVGGAKSICKIVIAMILGLLIGGYVNNFQFDQTASLSLQISSVSVLFFYCLSVAYGMFINSDYLRKSRDKLMETADTIAMVNKVLKDSSSALSMDDVMRSLLNPFSTNFFDAVAFIHYEPSKDLLEVINFEGIFIDKRIIELLKKIQIPVTISFDNDSYILSVFESGNALYVGQIDHAEKLSPIDCQFYKLASFHGIFIIPISLKSQLTGLLVFFAEQKNGVLNPFQLEILKRYFLQFSIVINNALTHKKLMDDINEIDQERRRYEKFNNELSKYLSPNIYKRVFNREHIVEISSQYKFLTICCTDIVGFTALSEHIEPEEMTVMLNYYLNEMNTIAFKYDGTVDKYLGDSIQLFFGDPVSNGQETDAILCCKMALEMQSKVEELQHVWMQHGITKQLLIRIGIHSGYCSVGNFGSSYHMQYSIVGEPVSIASELQRNCVPGHVLISKSTFNLVSDHFECKKIMKSSESQYEILGEKPLENT